MGNLNSVQSVYDAFAKGDISRVLGFLSPDIEWTEAEGFPYGGTYVGPNAVLEGVFMRLGTEWEGFAAVPDEFIDGGDTVVVLGKYGQELSGKLRACLEGARGESHQVCAVRGHADRSKGITTIDYGH